jgi:Mg2+ and Co2+ transporter CorA
MKYHWSKVNLFTRWFKSTEQTGILLFGPPDDLSTPLFDPNPTQLNDPFWMYSDILGEVGRLQEGSVWGIREYVRDIEKAETPADQKPNPNYRRLHDIARHAIHVTETLDVAAQNIDHIIKQHEIYTNMLADPQPRAHQLISRRLAFFQSYVGSIRHRSVSNQLRLQNEIQLAFNIVAQHDTSVTVGISRAARSDSATMKTLAFVTTTFLPPTFLCAVFSMSFFHYDLESGWGVSDKLWIYWVCTIPTIVVSVLLWYFWPKMFSDHSDAMRGKKNGTELPTFI